MKSIDISHIFGKWNIDVDTPFGKEYYTLNIDAINLLNENVGSKYITGSISHEKGSVSFDKASLDNNRFYCLVETEFPIKSTVSITSELIDYNKMSGMLEIDQYLVTSFIGVK